jgi:hypothetical protein
LGLRPRQDDLLHYIPVLARKPGALRNGSPFKAWDLPSALRRVQRKLERQPGGDRQTAKLMVFKLVQFADKSRRRLKGANQWPFVIEGVTFTGGVVVRAAENRAA